MAIDFSKIKNKVGKWGSEYAQNLNQNLGLDNSLINNSTNINTATQNIQADSSANNLTQLSGVLGGMVGDVVTAGGGDANVAQGISTAISQAPDMFNAIKDFDASSFKAGLGSSMNIAGIAGNVLGAFAEDRASLSGEYGQLSKNAEMVADTVLSSIPGFGQAYTAINGVSDFLAGKYDNLSTAGSTKSDAIMDAIPVLGLLNAAAGEEMNEIKYDKKTWDTVGSSYAGSQKSVKDASDNTGGRYGWLSTITGEYQKDLAQNIEGARQQTMASKISDEATEASERASSTIQEANIKQQNKLAGNNFTFRVQKGLKLPNKEEIQSTKKLLTEPKVIIPSVSPDYSIFKQDEILTKVEEFKEGGKMNIIPEGELHARLHHMDQEGITKKGIPVISEEEGGEIVQHAEIERNEIIFCLEVTKKLEELMEDGSEEAALEAGKLLADEILNNTEDRTGLLNEVQ